jgi:VanZ family protein
LTRAAPRAAAVHKSSAGPLALAYGLLIVYASLYPFDGWRDQGVEPWAYLWAPWPRYWTWFDVTTNLVGYAPLGFFVALGLLRSQRSAPIAAVAWAIALGCALTLLMEGLQSYLPLRVPSSVDAALNAAGAMLGGLSAWGAERLGLVGRWSRFRSRWFDPDARGALVLLALWPAALLFPAPVPLGLGHVMQRVEDAALKLIQDTPLAAWWPIRDVELQPLLPITEAVCVGLGLLAPVLLACAVIGSIARRGLAAIALLAVGLSASTLSSALTYGPAQMLAWWNPSVRLGLFAAVATAALVVWLPRRACWAMLLLCVTLSLALLNQAPEGPYFALTLQVWEQGRFIRFHGLARWLGWVWPYLVLALALWSVSRPTRRGDNALP